jgi:SAM-dependent methyltransferase
MENSVQSSGATYNHILQKSKSLSWPRISVATVADYVESYELLPLLATNAGDLKDVQRPWAVKAIFGSVPRHSRLCEIGAGEPLVADILQRSGYSVTVVDPYRGLGQGPTEFEPFKTKYPNLRFIRELFSNNVPGLVDGEFDAIYSISVLEHVHFDLLNSVTTGIHRYLKPSGRHIHAIDYVLAGNGDEYHFELLRRLSTDFHISSGLLMHTLSDATKNPETYFLSAEAHNRWRGDLPYSEFPMRKVISIQLSLESY